MTGAAYISKLLHRPDQRKKGRGYMAISKILWREFRINVAWYTVRDWIKGNERNRAKTAE